MAKYILTGGPCTGKTSNLLDLKEKGYSIVSEVPRQIIKEELEKAEKDPSYTAIIPTTDLKTFQDMVIERQIYLEKCIKEDIMFLDRSLIDPIAYSELGGFNPPERLPKLIEEAGYTKVFYFEKLPMYICDQERAEDPEFAEAIHKKILKVYSRFQNIELIIVPFMEIDKRTEFIIKHL